MDPYSLIIFKGKNEGEMDDIWFLLDFLKKDQENLLHEICELNR